MLEMTRFAEKRLSTRWLSYICLKLSGRSKADVTAPRAAIVRRVLGCIMEYLGSAKKKLEDTAEDEMVLGKEKKEESSRGLYVMCCSTQIILCY